MSKQIEFVVFWVVVFIVIVIAMNHNRFSKKAQRGIVLVFVVLFSVLYAYRTLGMDLRAYSAIYMKYSVIQLENQLRLSRLLSNEYEPLYLLFLYISKRLDLSFEQSQLVFVLVPSIVFFLFMRRTSFPLATYLLFTVILMYHVDLTRLYIAMAFLMLGFFSDKKWKKTIWYIVAIGFHYSCIFLPLCEVLVRKRWSKRKIFILLLGTAVGVVIFKYIDLSSLEGSQFRILFKLQYYLRERSIGWQGSAYMRVMRFLISLYPTVMCVYLSKELRKIRWSKEESVTIDRISSIMQIGAIVSIFAAVVFSSFAMSFRIQLLTYYMLFIPISDYVGKNINSGVISGKAKGILFSLFLYDIFMSLYYIGVSIVY